MNKILLIVCAVLLLSAVIYGCAKESATVDNGTAAQKTGQTSVSGPIACDDLTCLQKNFLTCTPAEMRMSSGDMNVVITLFGLTNNKCHYKMDMGGGHGGDCYFPQDALNTKVLNQMFGNNEGQEEIVANNCVQS